MIRKLDWDINLINRPKYELTGENPVRLSLTDHKKNVGSLFDMHYPLELGILLYGRMKRHYQGCDLTLKAGDSWTCGMWEPHGFKVLEVPSRTLVLVINPQLLIGLRFDELPGFNPMSFFTAPPKERPKLTKQKRLEIAEVAARLDKLFKDTSKERAARLRICLYEILLIMSSGWTPAKAEKAAEPGSFSIVNKAVQMVFNSKTLVTEQRAARECGLGRNRFNLLFEKTMGLSFSKFAIKFRLSKVAGSLLHSDEPLKAIAASWGFVDTSHLHRLFLQYYECSPMDYRKRYTKKH
ncbi:MAG: helix-turn-helix transcriptional regulator [Candidatus Firestonebacteria bacterium]